MRNATSKAGKEDSETAGFEQSRFASKKFVKTFSHSLHITKTCEGRVRFTSALTFDRTRLAVSNSNGQADQKGLPGEINGR
jgi:hypothetical protein